MKKTFKLKLKDDNGKDVVLEVVANFKTTKAVEEACGRSVIEVVTDLASGKIKYTEVAKIVHAALEAKGDTRRTEDEVGELIHNVGFMEAIKDTLDEFICALAFPQMGAVDSGKGQGA